jgi:hypothetical protein
MPPQQALSPQATGAAAGSGTAATVPVEQQTSFWQWPEQHCGSSWQLRCPVARQAWQVRAASQKSLPQQPWLPWQDHPVRAQQLPSWPQAPPQHR